METKPNKQSNVETKTQQAKQSGKQKPTSEAKWKTKTNKRSKVENKNQQAKQSGKQKPTSQAMLRTKTNKRSEVGTKPNKRSNVAKKGPASGEERKTEGLIFATRRKGCLSTTCEFLSFRKKQT